MEHIEGLWSVSPQERVGGYAIECVESGVIAVSIQRDAGTGAGARKGVSMEEAKAHAHLIAASPIFRKALERILMPAECGCKPCTGQCQSLESLEIELETIRDIAATALAQAAEKDTK